MTCWLCLPGTQGHGASGSQPCCYQEAAEVCGKKPAQCLDFLVFPLQEVVTAFLPSRLSNPTLVILKATT